MACGVWKVPAEGKKKKKKRSSKRYKPNACSSLKKMSEPRFGANETLPKTIVSTNELGTTLTTDMWFSETAGRTHNTGHG